MPGRRAFGENYIQEAVDKITALSALPDRSGIASGPSRATRPAWWPSTFEWVHTVDRLKIAQRLSDQRPPHLPPLQVCIQVNVDGGPTKSGVTPQDAVALALEVAQLPRLQLQRASCAFRSLLLIL